MKKLFMLLFALTVVGPVYAAKLQPETTVLITKAEEDAFKKLKSDEERKQFEKQFWEKRDPTPATPENEYRDEIKKRIKDVGNALRRNDAWETDMGQTLVLLGPPAKVLSGAERTNQAEATWYPEAEEGSGRESDTASAEAQGEAKRTFIYTSLPSGVSSGETQVEFLQVRNRWSFKESKTSKDLLEKVRANELTRFAQGKGSAAPAAPATPQAAKPAAPAQPAAPMISAEMKSALDATSSGTAPSGVTLSSKTGTFQTSTGEIFGTVAVNATGAAAGAKTGIRVTDTAGKVVHEAELPFEATGETAGYFQTNFPVPAPGDYTVAVVVANGSQSGGMKQSITVPDGSKFNASSLILARKFTTLTEAKPEKEPYTFGKIKVHPTLDGAFAKSEDLIIVYEVYNPQIDTATGKPNLEAQYSFEREGGKPKKTPPAPPNGLLTGKKMTISTSYPLQTFAAGKYKLNVEITDKATGEKITRVGEFEVQ